MRYHDCFLINIIVVVIIIIIICTFVTSLLQSTHGAFADKYVVIYRKQ